MRFRDNRADIFRRRADLAAQGVGQRTFPAFGRAQRRGNAGRPQHREDRQHLVRHGFQRGNVAAAERLFEQPAIRGALFGEGFQNPARRFRIVARIGRQGAEIHTALRNLRRIVRRTVRSENSEKKRQKEISISYLNIFTKYSDELKTIVIQLVKLRNLLAKNNDSFVEYLGGHNIHAFILKNTKGRELGNARMFKFDNSSLSYIYSNSASVNVNISERYQFLYKHSIQINTYIENLILKIHYDNSKENILDYFSDLSLDESIHTIDLCVKGFKDYSQSL